MDKLLGAGKEAKLETWIRTVTGPDKGVDEPCTAIALCHGSVAGPKEEVLVKRLGASQDTPEALARLFRGRAEGYAEDLPGVQVFWLLAFYANAKEPNTKLPFRVTGSLRYDDTEESPEAPDLKGMRQQGMRHTEQATAIAFRAVEQANRDTRAAMSLALDFARTLGGIVDNLHSENTKARDKILEVMVETIQAQNTQEMDRLKFARETGERQALMQAAPGLVNTLLGKEVFPQSVVDTKIVEAAARVLPREAVEQFALALGEEHGLVLMKRFEEVLRKDREQKEQSTKLLDRTRDLPIPPEHA